MAKAPAKTAKKKSFKKKEKKNVPVGIVPHPGDVQQHDSDVHRSDGQHAGVVEFRVAGFPRIAQRHSICRSAGGLDGCEQGEGQRAADRGRGSGQRTRVGPRIGHARSGDGGHRSQRHQRHDTDSAQRVPSAEKAARLSLVTAPVEAEPGRHATFSGSAAGKRLC